MEKLSPQEFDAFVEHVAKHAWRAVIDAKQIKAEAHEALLEEAAEVARSLSSEDPDVNPDRYACEGVRRYGVEMTQRMVSLRVRSLGYELLA